MPGGRLMAKLVSSLGGLSSGAVRALVRAGGNAGDGVGGTVGIAGLEIVPPMVRLMAETVRVPASQSDAEVKQIERYLLMLIERYGVMRRAIDALGTGKRRHPLVSPDRAKAWQQTLAAVPAVADQTLAHHATLQVAVSKWMTAQGDSLEKKLDDHAAWMDGPLDENALNIEIAAAGPLSTNAPGESVREMVAPSASLTEEQEKDLALVRAAWLDDKRPGEPGAARRMPGEVREAVERLRGVNDARVKAYVAVACGEFAKTDEQMPMLDGRMPPAEFLTLQGDRLYFDKRFDDAAKVYRQARSQRDNLDSRKNLAMALVRCQRGSAAEHAKEAIDLLVDALRPMPTGTREWGRARTLLGMVWFSLHWGERDANIRHAIECFESAVESTKRETDPEWWAETYLHLGSAWHALPSGKVVENIQRAITCFSRAAEVWTREARPEEWATIQNHLGHAWERLPTGLREVNIQRAIEYFNAALTVRTREEHPAAWAQLQNNLGNAWIQVPGGERRENIEKAITHHSAALEVWSAQHRRSEWAATQNNLGNALALLPAQDDERERNLRRAIACYKAALEVRTRNGAPTDWAATLNNLGNALLALPKARGANHVDEAIDCFRKALEVRTRQAFPTDWAKTRANLGHAYALLDDDERRENLEEAVLCYQSALEVLTPTAYAHLHEHVMERLNEVQDELRKMR
ncbi:MAG TPA: tetratricopeptide repeat protein [Phycisphaerales bacterium]|nr:tetratricopeptide repeat protein [Phycisphaerales bacterium]